MTQDPRQADLFGPQAARAARAEGYLAAERAADRAGQGWRGQAFNSVAEYARTHDRFKCEEARTWAEKRGFPKPPDRRAWGAVMRRAESAGIVEYIGKRPGVAAHGQLMGYWQSRVLEGQRP